VLAIETAVDELQKLIEIERLENRGADGALRHPLDPSISRRGENDDVRFPIARSRAVDALEERVPVHAWHHQIEKHEVIVARLIKVEPDRAVLCEIDFESDPAEDFLQKDANGEVVFDDEHAPAAAIHRGVARRGDVMGLHRISSCRNKVAELTGSSNNYLEFSFRPWVRRAGLSILLAAAVATSAILIIALSPAKRYGWAEEPFVWIYVGVLWLGGLKIVFGTCRPVAEIRADRIVLRPLHRVKASSIRWSDVLGIEQMIAGDRMIVYFATRRGTRFVALNLNLVKGRATFVSQLEEELKRGGFVEKIVKRSRYLSRVGESR